MREFTELLGRVVELERRYANTIRHGTVEQVDAGKQRVRLRLGGSDDQPFIGPWVPYGQIAGALKVHTPPSVGQQMTMFSPAGDPRQAVAMPMTWSDQNASPSSAGDQHVLTFGSVRVDLAADSLKITIGGVAVTISGDGVTFEGGSITHDGHSIDKTHQHKDVEPGPALTGPPQ